MAFLCVFRFVVVKATGLPPPSPLPMSSQQQDSTSQVSSSTATASAAGEFQEREGELVYMFALRIHDDTAVTDAVVFGKASCCHILGDTYVIFMFGMMANILCSLCLVVVTIRTGSNSSTV